MTRFRGRECGSAPWMYASNLEAASRATPDTCAQACESAAGRGVAGVATHCAPAQCLLRLPTCLRISRVHAQHSFFASTLISYDSFLVYHASLIPRITPISFCFDDVKEYPFVILYIDSHNRLIIYFYINILNRPWLFVWILMNTVKF